MKQNYRPFIFWKGTKNKTIFFFFFNDKFFLDYSNIAAPETPTLTENPLEQIFCKQRSYLPYYQNVFQIRSC